MPPAVGSRTTSLMAGRWIWTKLRKPEIGFGLFMNL
jgi:hypothetical protein